MKIKSLVLSLIMILITSIGYAEDYNLQSPEHFNIVDWNVRLEASDAGSQVASGACRGPFYELYNGDKPIGEIGRACALFSVGTEGSQQGHGLLGIMIAQIWGVGPTVTWDPNNNDVAIGLGFSSMHWYKMFNGNTSTQAVKTRYVPLSFASIAPDYPVRRY